MGQIASCLSLLPTQAQDLFFELLPIQPQGLSYFARFLGQPENLIFKSLHRDWGGILRILLLAGILLHEPVSGRGTGTGKLLEDQDHKLLNWRYESFRLLVALDRTKQLEALLASWIQPGKAETAWRKALAYLKAESGQLKAAVEAFEGVASADELSPKDHHNLANWYLVLRDDARRDQAQLNRYQVMDLNQIAQRVNQERQRVSSRGNKTHTNTPSLQFVSRSPCR